MSEGVDGNFLKWFKHVEGVKEERLSSRMWSVAFVEVDLRFDD